ncbi:hypothetical protein [Streptomyces sp. CCM_MD2014]|uniref:hypothetical protein n=1 Tax=Streptomyces sp. CCM_MD2014 TaxID=1561022 RepID=UPI000AB8E4BD|nr:hypothetical protein [Streptomyces sp. CCM_MD2014]
MRRTTADRQRRRALVDISVTATTPVTEPGPVLPFPINPPLLPPRAERPRRSLEAAE